MFCRKNRPVQGGSDVSRSSDSSISDCDSKSNIDGGRCRQRKIGVELWDDVDKEVVQQLPDDINGDKMHIMEGLTEQVQIVAALQDGRKWKKNCPTSWNGHARVRYADCKGSHSCVVMGCPFKVQYGVINTTQFDKKKNGLLECKGCGKIAQFIPCPARRYVSYGKTSVKVYHCGRHTCPVIKPRVKNREQVKQLLKDNPNMKPAELQSACIISAFRQQSDWRDIEKQAEATLDRQWISNEKRKIKNDIEPVGHNFEAVVTFKQYCDKKDEFYIYKVNDRRGNPDKPSFVFKTSKQKAKMALNINRESDHFLNNEFCFFDGKYKRCRGFVTLTSSVYHTLLRKQVTLAVMEAETEDTENVTLFWTLFNEVLKKVSGDKGKMFNPTGWCTDMAGANLAGLCNVYGDTAKYRIKSCEFHFKDHRNKKANKLDPESSEEFKELCEQLLDSVTENQYDIVKKQLDSFISANDERSFLGSWLSWWHDRRGFIFRAFAPTNAPCMNQAEVIHAGWAHRDRPNLSLLEVCQADVRDAIVLDVELKAYARGTAMGGGGPSHIQRKRKQHVREIDQAKQLGAEIFQNDGEDNNGRTVDPVSSFHPIEKKKRSRKKTSKQNASNRKQVTVTETSTITNYQNPSSNLAPSRHPFLPLPHSAYAARNSTSTTGLFSTNSRFLQAPPAYSLPGFPMISTTVANNSVTMSAQQPSMTLIERTILLLDQGKIWLNLHPLLDKQPTKSGILVFHPTNTRLSYFQTT